jgi:predicted glutamine amidotransferase
VSLVLLHNGTLHTHTHTIKKKPENILQLLYLSACNQSAFFKMTSFTKTLPQNEASIYTSPDHAIADINPLMYGGFTE